MSSVFIFDAYGTLFDVHAAIARHRKVRSGLMPICVSAIWRTKQLEYSWTLTLAGHYTDFWILTQRALDYRTGVGTERRPIAQARRCSTPISSLMPFPTHGPRSRR